MNRVTDAKFEIGYHHIGIELALFNFKKINCQMSQAYKNFKSSQKKPILIFLSLK
jgi:hypothetical protein